MPSTMTPGRRRFSLYIHIPFCEKKCLYCDFVSGPADEWMYSSYVDAVVTELALWQKIYGNRHVTSVYLGGGTPSLLGGERLNHLLLQVRGMFRLDENAEITLEANPGTVSSGFFETIQRGGYGRVSIGAQSFSDHLLRSLGRIHDAEAARQAVVAAQEAGIYNVGIDLIYGIPGQTRADWRTTLNESVALRPSHVSVYCLSYEEGTPLWSLRNAGRLTALPDSVEEEMYRTALAVLRDGGYRRYEISNFAIPNMECRHNLNYWECGDYLGIGVGAHSFMDGSRWENAADTKWYIADPGRGTREVGDPLSSDEFFREFLMLGLRKADGIILDEVERGWGRDAKDRVIRIAKDPAHEGLLCMDGGRLFITDEGLFVSNRLMAAFF